MPPLPPAGASVAIWNAARVEEAIDNALSQRSNEAEGRQAAVTILTEAQDLGRAAIADMLARDPVNARPVARVYAWLTDQLVNTALIVAQRLRPPPANPTRGEHLAILATGGFGRSEMAPFSDVDLLFLTPGKITPSSESTVETVLYILWDLHLSLGHATRSMDECLRLARDDMVIRTSLLEMRHLAGERALSAKLQQRLHDEVFSLSPAPYIGAKLAERDARHMRQGGQRYMVEPNVKQGKGGLRDLQSLYWIAKHVTGAQTSQELVTRGLFSPDEYETFTCAEDFLWAVRIHLHLCAGRALERLSFDMQIEVAARMGYRDHSGRRGVEHFMHDTFRHATRVGELTRILLAGLEERHLKPEPPLLLASSQRKRIRAPFALRRGRLTVTNQRRFLAEPLNMLAAFDEAQRVGALMHPDALRLIAAHLDLIDDTLRTSPEANRLFLGLLTRHSNPEHALRRMNEVGVLGTFIPEFGAVVAMMQFNMYHHYTVDEHTIQAISHLARIERGEMKDALPVSSDILDKGVNRRVLYVALLLHDTGKGGEESHTLAGARIARRVAPRLGLNRRDSETVEWLVRNHLLMSDMAQKRDIADPRTVRDFVKAVGTQERLDLLTVLTVCDISGVGPGVWNNWKAMLLRRLWIVATQSLARGKPAPSGTRHARDARRTLRETLADWPASQLRAETRRHEAGYWQGLPSEAHLTFAHLLRDRAADEIQLSLDAEPERDATRICIVMEDAPGLFAHMTGALAVAQADVVDARMYTTRDGWATVAFWVQDHTGQPYTPEAMARLERQITKALGHHETIAPEEAPQIDKRIRAFRVPTAITFDNEASEHCTIIEVEARDRPALLHDLSRAIAGCGVQIVSAVIATYGEQAVDTFYVQDRCGKKLPSGTKREWLKARLQAAIDPGMRHA